MDSLRNQRRSPGSERFLGVSSASPSSSSGNWSASLGAELLEDDVLFSPSPEHQHHHSRPPPMPANPNPSPVPILFPRGGAQRGGLGILAVLPEDGGKRPPVGPPVHQRRFSISPSSSSASPSPSSSAARAIPSISMPKPEYSLYMPSGKIYHQSVPVKVPVTRPRRPPRAETEWGADESGDDDEKLPPHEMVARNSPMTTFSVLEGAGRTLKGRDLRRVRNAVFRQTGFLD